MCIGIILYIIYSSIGRLLHYSGSSVARLCRARRPARWYYAIIEYYSALSELLRVGGVKVRRRGFRLGGGVKVRRLKCSGRGAYIRRRVAVGAVGVISLSIVFIVMFCLMRSFFIFYAIIDGS